jgi:hypothetical protein
VNKLEVFIMKKYFLVALCALGVQALVAEKLSDILVKLSASERVEYNARVADLENLGLNQNELGSIKLDYARDILSNRKSVVATRSNREVSAPASSSASNKSLDNLLSTLSVSEKKEYATRVADLEKLGLNQNEIDPIKCDYAREILDARKTVVAVSSRDKSDVVKSKSDKSNAVESKDVDCKNTVVPADSPMSYCIIERISLNLMRNVSDLPTCISCEKADLECDTRIRKSVISWVVQAMDLILHKGFDRDIISFMREPIIKQCTFHLPSFRAELARLDAMGDALPYSATRK